MTDEQIKYVEQQLARVKKLKMRLLIFKSLDENKHALRGGIDYKPKGGDIMCVNGPDFLEIVHAGLAVLIAKTEQELEGIRIDSDIPVPQPVEA